MFGKTKLAAIATVAMLGVGTAVDAATMANWTFETSVPLTAGPHAAEGGLNAASSFATGVGGTAYTNPVGNGSAESFSANGWAVGEYFQFTTSTTGFEDVMLSFSQTGSNTGPRDFSLSYSTDGASFTPFASYTVLFASPSWTSSSVNATTTYAYDLSSIASLDNDASIFFRLINNSTASVNGGTTASTGTGRVDDFTISATAIPEPASLGLIGAAGLLALRRRRQA